MKSKTLKAIMLFLCICMLLSSCAGEKNEITVVSREDGSGTRGAFVELVGILEKDSNSSKIDRTSEEAIVANKTDIMLNNISSDPNAIGYVSVGSLNDSIKAISINGIEPTSENIKNGTYELARPFNIATTDQKSDLTEDFISFILSSDGQLIVAQSYVEVTSQSVPYNGAKPSGKITVSGSSSVTPVMEKLVESYLKINTNAQIEIQQSDSSTGIQSAIDGTCDIAMASRELKEDEKEKLIPVEIAIDGIAVIVNTDNTINDINLDNLKKIFVGEYVNWNEVNG